MYGGDVRIFSMVNKIVNFLQTAGEAVLVATIGVMVLVLLGILAALGLVGHNVEKLLEKK